MGNFTSTFWKRIKSKLLSIPAVSRYFNGHNPISARVSFKPGRLASIIRISLSFIMVAMVLIQTSCSGFDANGNPVTSNTVHLDNIQGNITTGTGTNLTGFLKGNGTVVSADANTYLTTESDPVTKAINGIVKSNGTTINAAVAGTDYSNLGYALQVGATSVTTWNDGANAYFGNPSTNANSSSLSKYIIVPKAGHIKSIYLIAYCGTEPSNEAWEAYLQISGGSDYLIESSTDTTNNLKWENSSLNISINAGDQICIKLINPTWSTNPVNVLFSGSIYIGD